MKQEIKLEDVFNEKKIESIKEMIDRHNQETLEEVADLWSIDTNNVHPADSYIAKQGFIAGAKWQQEQDQNVYLNGYVDGSRAQAKLMYNDEEVLNFTQTILMQYKFGNTNIEQMNLLKETLEQFKNNKDYEMDH